MERRLRRSSRVLDAATSNHCGDTSIDNNDLKIKSAVMNGSVNSTKANSENIPLKNRKLSHKNRDKEDDYNEVIGLEFSTDDGFSSNGDKASTSKGETVEFESKEETKSLVTVISQCLNSHDRERLDSVLLTSDSMTVATTLDELPSNLVIPLLKEIEYLLRNRNVQDIRPWIVWLSYTIKIHFHRLYMIGSLTDELQSLFQWIRDRISSLNTLHKLEGKFSCIVEQMERRSNPLRYTDSEPLVKFQDNWESSSEGQEATDDEDEDNDENASDNWWEDDEIALKSSDDSESNVNDIEMQSDSNDSDNCNKSNLGSGSESE